VSGSPCRCSACANSKGSSTVAMPGTRAARSCRCRAMRSAISASPARAVAMKTARCPADCASPADANASARRDLPLRCPPRISSLRASVNGSTMLCTPRHDDAVQVRHAVAEGRRAGLQDVGGLDLEQLAVPHRAHVLPARTRRNFLGPKLLAAPRADDDVGIAPHDLRVIGNDAVLAARLPRQFRKTVVAAGNADQLGDPADRADVRLVPLLEVDARAPRQSGGDLLDGTQLLQHLL